MDQQLSDACKGRSGRGATVNLLIYTRPDSRSKVGLYGKSSEKFKFLGRNCYQ